MTKYREKYFQIISVHFIKNHEWNMRIETPQRITKNQYHQYQHGKRNQSIKIYTKGDRIINFSAKSNTTYLRASSPGWWCLRLRDATWPSASGCRSRRIATSRCSPPAPPYPCWWSRPGYPVVLKQWPHCNDNASLVYRAQPRVTTGTLERGAIRLDRWLSGRNRHRSTNVSLCIRKYFTPRGGNPHNSIVKFGNRWDDREFWATSDRI